ncbi:MAG: prohibitin family protein [Clostridia bacterium]|nr:prohibitin family protein [Clostridia bacterium]
MNKGYVGAIVLAVVILVGIIVGVSCLTKIDAGYVGVVYNMKGGVEDEVLSQGWHWISPTKKVTTYSIGIEQSYLTSEHKGDSPKDESFNIPTSDGKTVRVNLEFSYKFDADRVSETFVSFKGRDGEEIKNTFIKPKIIAWTQEISANYPVTDIFGDKRTQINAELDVYLREKFEPYGIVIDTVNFTDISVDEETAEAIQRKVTAQQELELAEIEAKTAMIQAEKDKEVAMKQAEAEKEVALINAEQKKIAADAEAYQIKVKAEAEAEANKKLAESLTDELINYAYAQSWNGELPIYMGGGSGTIPVLDMNK